MLRILLFALIAYVVYKIFFSPRKKIFTRVTQSFKNAQGGHNQIETLISCPVCNTFFQNAQGVFSGGKMYCSAKCAKLQQTS